MKLDNLPATRPDPQPSSPGEAATPHLASRGQKTPGLWHPEPVSANLALRGKIE